MLAKTHVVGWGKKSAALFCILLTACTTIPLEQHPTNSPVFCSVRSREFSKLSSMVGVAAFPVVQVVSWHASKPARISSALSSKRDFNKSIHGKWCGQGYPARAITGRIADSLAHPPVQFDVNLFPVSLLDAQCMQHDFCYFIAEEDVENELSRKRACDAMLDASVSVSMLGGRYGIVELSKAQAVLGWLSVLRAGEGTERYVDKGEITFLGANETQSGLNLNKLEVLVGALGLCGYRGE